MNDCKIMGDGAPASAEAQNETDPGLKKYRILYNPLAGNGRGEAGARELCAALSERGGAETLLDDITKIPPYPEYFASLGEDDVLVLCGGDGTINRFVNDCGELPENELLFCPAGTGNDFANDLGIKKGELVGLKRYLQNLPEITVKGMKRRFINGIGYGIDGYCCEEGDRIREKSPGKKINYTGIAIKGLLFYFKPTNAEVIVDGVVRHYKRVWLAPTMKGRYFGGGMMSAPGQDRLAPDGTVSVVVAHDSGKLRTLKMFPSIFTGEHIRYKNIVDVFTGREVTVRFDRPTALQIDGETVRDVTEYSVRS